jgi:Fe-S oxidoreductase
MAEARETGASVVATACPFCTIMLEGETGPGELLVRDVAEILWEAQAAASPGASP